MSISLAVLNRNPIQFRWNIIKSILKGVLRNFLVNKQDWIYIHHNILHLTSHYIIITEMHCMCVLDKHVECINFSQKMCRAVFFSKVVKSFAHPGLFQLMLIRLQSYSQVQYYISLFWGGLLSDWKNFTSRHTKLLWLWNDVERFSQCCNIWNCELPVVYWGLSDCASVTNTHQRNSVRPRHQNTSLYMPDMDPDLRNKIKLFNVISDFY